MKEKEFIKYKAKRADYHYNQIDRFDFFGFRARVLARFNIHIKLLGKYIKKNEKKGRRVRILDVGCGDGVLLFLIKKKLKDFDFSFYGVDYSDEALEVAKSKVKGTFKKKGVYESGLKDDFFDVVISSDVIEHVSGSEKMLKEIGRVAKNNAIIIIGTPIRTTEFPIDTMHVHEFFPREFKKMCSNFFEVIELKKTHPLLTILLYEKSFKILWKKIEIFKYIINLFAVFGYNFFEKSYNDNTEKVRCSYMFAVCKNKRNESGK